MRFLRTNTAVLVTCGPFYDKTDGCTIEGALTITNERITLTADTDAGAAPTNILDNVTGATSGTANDLNYITGNDAGMMQLELAAADVNRLGRLLLSITDAANHVPVFHEFMVLPAAIYDWFILGTIVPLPANVTTWLGTAAATPTVAGVPEVDVTHYAGSTSGVSTIPTNVSNIATGVTDTNTLVNDIYGRIPTALTVDGFIKADLQTLLGTEQTAGDIIGDTNDIQGRLPAALVSGRMDSSVGAMAANVMTAAAAAADLTTELQSGLATAANLATVDTVVDAILALLDDARGEPGQGAPPVNPDLATKIDYLYKFLRNKKTQTSTTFSLFGDDAATVDQKSTVSDDGTTLTSGEVATGP
jgi:hypothetical protein